MQHGISVPWTSLRHQQRVASSQEAQTCAPGAGHVRLSSADEWQKFAGLVRVHMNLISLYRNSASTPTSKKFAVHSRCMI